MLIKLGINSKKIVLKFVCVNIRYYYIRYSLLKFNGLFKHMTMLFRQHKKLGIFVSGFIIQYLVTRRHLQIFLNEILVQFYSINIFRLRQQFKHQYQFKENASSGDIPELT